MDSRMKTLSKYRFDCAIEDIENAKTMLEAKQYKLTLNRSYYAIFHAMRAVTVLDDFDSSKHSGIIAHFNQHHVKTGDFPKDTSKIIKSASEMRELADYKDFYIASGQEAMEQVANAERFVSRIQDYLKKLGVL